MKIELKLVRANAKIPQYATSGAAACDLSSAADEDISLKPGEVKLIPTGIAIAIPDKSAVALIYARSGMSVKRGLAPANCVGVIDSDYRGEIFVPLRNNSSVEQTVAVGERIAQLMLTPVITAEFERVGELDPTARGEGGFGSTGNAEYSLLSELCREERSSMLDILEESFPESERRDREKQAALFEDSDYHSLAIRVDGVLVGFMAYWTLDDVIYCEHFAIKSDRRGGGLGRRAMKELLSMHEGKKIVLECEHKEFGSVAQRRIGFYESLGFVVNDQPYKQPPYKSGMDWVKMHVLSYGGSLGDGDFSRIKKLLYGRIYGVDERD